MPPVIRALGINEVKKGSGLGQDSFLLGLAVGFFFGRAADGIGKTALDVKDSD
jgi:hypothetical protein